MKVMKRRFQSDTGDPSHVQSSSIGGFARDLELNYRYGKSKGKRVRVTGIDRECLSNDVSDGVPKTSEYAYFKKVKESMIQHNHHFRDTECDQESKDAGSCYADAQQKLKEKMKAPYTNDSIREASRKSITLNCDVKDKFSALPEKVSLNSRCMFVLPEVGRCKGPGEECPVGSKCSPFLNHKTVDKILHLSPQSAPSKYSGSQYLENDIFSAKRQKLRRWAEMSFAGTENLTSKGCDMLTLLLSRLSPNGNENHGSRTTDDTRCSHVLPEMDLSEMRHDHSYKRGLTTSEFEIFQSRELSRWSGTTRDLLDWPDLDSYNYVTKFNAKTIPHSEVVDNSQASYGAKAKSLLKQIGSPVHLNYEGYGYSDWYHHEEPEKVYLQYESPRREAETLLLDWDSGKEKDEPETAMVTASSCQHITHSQIVTPSLLPDHSLHVCALPFHLTALPGELNSSPSSSLYNGDHGNGVSYFLDDLQYTPDKCSGEKRNLDCDAFLLPVVLNVTEWNILTATGFPWREHFFQHGYRSSGCGIEPEKAWNMGCSSSTRIGFQEASVSHALPSCNFRTSFDRMIGYPLLLEDSNGARSDNEPFIGGSDEWKSS